MSSDASADAGSGLTDGSLLGGRYRLGELLGVGSSAAVFAAVDVTAGEGDPPIAVKVLHAHLCQDRDTLMAFLREGKAASAVRDPGVVGVYGWGRHEAGGLSVGWLALERIDGDNLSDLVHVRGALPVGEAVEVMLGVLDGLEAIHAAGLVHRDVTPRNVLITSFGEGPITRDRVHVADLGLADVTGRTARIGDLEVAGTPAYISPEQVLGHAVDARADLYQAGALLYFLVTGQPPYPRSTTEKVIHAHLYAPPPVPSVHVHDAVPLDRLVTRALAKQPANRFQSAEEFRTALEAAQHEANAGVVAAPAINATAVLPAATTPAAYLAVGPVASAPGTYRRARPDSRLGTVAAIVIALLVLIPVVQTVLPGPASAASTPSPPVTSVANAVVPLLTGTLQDAKSALVAQGFVVGQVTTRNSGSLEGTLVEQHPEPGSLAPRGSTVDLVVATGRNAVPQLAGLTVAAATAQLKAAGLMAAAGHLTSGTIVGGSSPSAGQVVRVGSTVALTATATTASASPSPSAPTESPSASTTPDPSTIRPSSTPASATRTSSASASGGA